MVILTSTFILYFDLLQDDLPIGDGSYLNMSRKAPIMKIWRYFCDDTIQ